MLRYNPGMLVEEMAARAVALEWTRLAIDLVPRGLAKKLQERGLLWLSWKLRY